MVYPTPWEIQCPTEYGIGINDYFITDARGNVVVERVSSYHAALLIVEAVNTKQTAQKATAGFPFDSEGSY